MYQFPYTEIIDDAPKELRAHERQAIQQSIDLLETARAAGTRSRESLEALLFVRRLWATLIEDLARPENDFSESLRADIISIGLWIMREAEQIRNEKSDNYAGLIEVSQTLCEGLR